MRRKIWTENDLQPVSAIAAGGRSVVAPAIGGGEALNSAGQASRLVPSRPDATAGGEAIPNSDLRLKTDVVRIGSTDHGLPLYRFRYKGRPGTYSGVWPRTYWA